MYLTTDEIIKRINNRLEYIVGIGVNIIHGKIFVHNRHKEVKFELRNIEPKNTGEFLDWFIVTKEQAAEVITKFKGEDDAKKELECINDFIIEKGLSEDKPLYLAPFIDDA